MKKTLAALAVAALAVVGLAACDTSTPEVTQAPTSEEPQAPKAEKPAPEEAQLGTRDNPARPGDTFELGAWKLTVGKTDTNATDEVMKAEADELYGGDMEWATPPEDGNDYVVLPVTLTYTGEDRSDPGVDLSFVFVTADGRSFDQTGSASVETDIWTLGDMYTDATADGTVLMEVPVGAAKDGTWRITSSSDLYADEVYVATK